MRIQFCGADRTVTGSCHLVEANGLRIFLDMGMYQGPREEARRLNQWLPDDVKNADAVLLTHGHLDHCGKLPVIARAGYRGPIYCTAATAEVARIVMEDAGEIQEEDASYLNRRSLRPGEAEVQPLFRRADVPAVMRLMRGVSYGQKMELARDGKQVSFTFYDAGHILGSAYIILEWTENGRQRSLLYTGDVGRYNTPIIRDPQAITSPVEQFITESTYGNKTHGDMAEVEPQLLEAVRYCVQHNSRLLCPAFAVGRTQVILWYVQKFVAEGLIPSIPVFVDSPMGVDVSRIHSQFPEYYDDETRKLIGSRHLFGLSRVTFAASTQQSMQINSQRGPCVIIASSPTCEFGRILHHLKQSIERPDDVIIFTGWTPPNTLGRRIQDGQRRVRIYDRWYELRCQVRTIHGLSAHADGSELLRFLSPTLHRDTTGYICHGEEDQAEAFGVRILSAGVGRVVVPAMESSSIST